MYPAYLTAKTWLLLAAMVGIVLFQGWLAYSLIGDLGQPDWDYRPVPDVYGESPFAMYPPILFPQHVRGPQGSETVPLKALPIEGGR
jgi:hypothetical protein